MDSPPKLSGETLIVHHIPLVHCQVSGGRQGGCGSSLKRSNPFSPPENLGLSRTTSLPERDVLQREALLYSSLIQTSSGSWSSRDAGSKGGGRGGSTASDDSSFTSSNSEEQLVTAHTLPRTRARTRNPFRHNPFLLNAGDDEDDEDDGDNLNGYLEDSSFHLHSHTSSALDDASAPFHLHDLDLDLASEPFLLHRSAGGSSRGSLRGAASVYASDLSSHLEDLDVLGLDAQRRHGSSGSNVSMDCGEQDWADDDDEDEDHPMRCGRSSKTDSCSSSCSAQLCSCCALSQSFPQQGCGSDSSCNSSEGVLVNFSAIFNKMNNGVPEKPRAAGSSDHSCASSVSDLLGNQQGSTGGAFYLDLHTSPTEPRPPQQPSLSSTFPLIRKPRLSTSSTCSCSAEHRGPLDLDANCNAFLPAYGGSSGDLTSCLQSQARLVVATQNYYKLVTCDLSSQSSPSPAGSSVHSCSEDNSKGSPTPPPQPSEYFLFRQRADEEEEEESPQRDDEDKDKEKRRSQKEEPAGSAPASTIMEGQVYVNVSPPLAGRSVVGGPAPSGNRLRSRSYDRNLDKCPSTRLGSLEGMMSCPVRLSEGAAQATPPAPPPPPPPPRVTSFAEIARSKRRNGGSPSTKVAAGDAFSSTHSHSSVDFSPILEQRVEAVSPVGSPVPFTRCYSHGSMERHLEGKARAEGGLSGSSDLQPAVVRYSKDQRPTTLPIQPFTFHHQFASKPAQPKPLLPLLTGYVSGMQARSGSGSGSGAAAGEDADHCSKLQQSYSDFLPDYFSLTEKPPEEFCLSPDASSSSSSSCSSSQSHISVDLTQKRGLVKAVNRAVDLIVTHFGTSRDPDVKVGDSGSGPMNCLVSRRQNHERGADQALKLRMKTSSASHQAKLGNSWVSPNVGHLILKYLCPALRDVLQDGLKAHTLDLIIGQRRCQPWNVVEASTQLGPSTRVLHSLFSKVSQFSELTSHSMRLNSFIFGLLNLKSLEFWFSHLYTHEDIVAAHFSPWGLLPLSQGACKPLFEELLLLLQPLSLLPFDLDLLFEPRLLQKGEEQLRRKEQLCSAGQSADRSGRSTLQLMRGRSTAAGDPVRDSEAKRERAGLRRQGTWPREGAGRGTRDRCKEREAEGPRLKGVGQESRDEGADLRGRQREDRQAGWWYQLMQSSQVYIDQSAEGSKFIKTEKRRKSSERRQNHAPPTREGVVEGAEAHQEGEGGRPGSSGSRGRPSWMGSPPESVLSQEKDPTPPRQDPGTGVQEKSPSQGQSLRWIRLFGSAVGSPLRGGGAEPRGRSQRTRTPSGWLGLDRSVLDLVALTIGVGGAKKAEPPASPTTAPNRPTETNQLSPRNVRALCHHIATEPGQLSFNKGDVLQVLRKADADWLLCSLGSTRGLVPIVYVTLSGAEDHHKPL
ncbi:iporin isoform X4 [Austrofundulus limnaeus]|uniref:Iporin isoform X4 n=1 Tax=Austrofundulus limnaeus TaxID=52670 RepID=A0A2I4C571_AUSLI|nr:PREDICTED: iporin-like isoform X4 [Austrofundulus limnaeus]